MSWQLPDKGCGPPVPTLVRLGRRDTCESCRGIGPPSEPVDRHAVQLAGDVPQGHVDGRDGVGHERPAAHVAVRAVQLLPEVLDARRVLAVEQLEERFGQAAGDLRLQAGDLAPAGDLVVGLDLDVGLGPDRRGVQGGDADAGGPVLRLAGAVGEGGFEGHAAAATAPTVAGELARQLGSVGVMGNLRCLPLVSSVILRKNAGPVSMTSTFFPSFSDWQCVLPACQPVQPSPL